MSTSNIPEKIKIRLWGQAAGRCEYDGCNIPLWRDDLTKAEFNIAYIAHIIADEPNGPRGHQILSRELSTDITNLMLLCDSHHRLIDREEVDKHTVDVLKEMKKKHEQRIEHITSFNENKRSYVILYGANVGKHDARIKFEDAIQAILNDKYPAERPGIELSLNSPYNDHEENYWKVERECLEKQFHAKVTPLISSREPKHFSIFAFAPQPLLMQIGYLFSDIQAADVFQLHREPPDWKWQASKGSFNYEVIEPSKINKIIALNLSLSATINESRITSVLGNDVSIWTITIDKPNNDFMKSKDQLSEFRKVFRQLMDKIKAKHGQQSEINVFPAVPVSIAVEIGRTIMPKADLPLKIYDENRSKGGFKFALSLGE